MEMRSVAVVGSGTMGNGIAHVFALGGCEVRLIDVKRALLDKALAQIRSNMERQAAKGQLTREAAGQAFSRILPSETLDAASSCGLVVEAVPEDMGVKKQVFRFLDAACPPETVLASNTSSLSITELGATTRRASKVIGMHFMNPVPVMRLVEIIRGLETSEETFRLARDVVRGLGKEPVCAKDFPGFISNRVLMPMINEACCALMEGVASAEDIDAVMKLGMAHPMGPLALADFIGLDVCLSILEVLQRGFGDPKYRPCPLLRQMVLAGRLGRKTGRGFYEYPA